MPQRIKTNKNIKSRNMQVEAIRAVLMFMVMAFHYFYQLNHVYGIETISFPSLAEWGKCAVGGFFIIMGFFAIPKDTSNFKFIPFIGKRIVRIMTAYVLAVTVVYLSVKLFGLPGKDYSFPQYLLNLPLINGLIGVPYVDGAHWFVLYSLIFYLDLGIVLKIKLKPKLYLLIWPISAVLVGLIRSMIDLPGENMISTLLGGKYVGFFIAGLAFHWWFKEKRTLKNVGKRYINIYVCTMIIAILMVCKTTGIFTSVFVTLFIVVFYLALIKKLKFLDKAKFLGFCGGISYPVYLIHQNIGYQLLIATAMIWEGNVFLCLIAVFVVTLIMIGAGYLIHRFWEKPVFRLLAK